ncbi:MAG: DUF4783 domain-containing protein [Bacteroidales bacterium]
MYILLILLIANSKAQEMNFPADVKKAIVSGNSEQLAAFFNQNVELLIKNKEDVYSKAQAEHIIKDFFSKNVPEDFKIEINEQSDGIRYAIGNLTTSGGKYRVYMVYQLIKSKYLINRLNISEYN